MGKNQKKKGTTLSLAEFAADTVQQDPMALPTAPRETCVPFCLPAMHRSAARASLADATALPRAATRTTPMETVAGMAIGAGARATATTAAHAPMRMRMASVS